jgi:hypothetical protein
MLQSAQPASEDDIPDGHVLVGPIIFMLVCMVIAITLLIAALL